MMLVLIGRAEAAELCTARRPVEHLTAVVVCILMCLMVVSAVDGLLLLALFRMIASELHVRPQE